MTVFLPGSPFIDSDNRTKRIDAPITADIQEKRHAAILPPAMVEGKMVLDLGCCVGATGHWCLSHGAKEYVGVEVQTRYFEAAKANLAGDSRAVIVNRSIPDAIGGFREPIFDVVVLAGVLYSFINPVSILEMAATVAKEFVVIESMYPYAMVSGRSEDFAFSEFMTHQLINSADGDKSYVAAGVRMSPAAVEMTMASLGFWLFGKPVYEPSQDDTGGAWSSKDGKLPTRFVRHFQRRGGRLPTIEAALAGDVSEIHEWR